MTTALLAVDARVVSLAAEQQLARNAKVVDAGKAIVGRFTDHLNAREEIVSTGTPGATSGKVIDLGAWRGEKIAPKGDPA